MDTGREHQFARHCRDAARLAGRGGGSSQCDGSVGGTKLFGPGRGRHGLDTALYFIRRRAFQCQCQALAIVCGRHGGHWDHSGSGDGAITETILFTGTLCGEHVQGHVWRGRRGVWRQSRRILGGNNADQYLGHSCQIWSAAYRHGQCWIGAGRYFCQNHGHGTTVRGVDTVFAIDGTAHLCQCSMHAMDRLSAFQSSATGNGDAIVLGTVESGGNGAEIAHAKGDCQTGTALFLAPTMDSI